MKQPSAAPEPAPPGPRWHQIATTAGEELRARADRVLNLSPRDRDKLARRLRDVIDSALDVPPDLSRRIAREVTTLRAAAGSDADPVELAWARTRQRARRTAAIGAVTTIPAVVPGLGPALAALGLVADWRYAAEQQRDLTLEIAELFGVPPADPTEQVRALFLASAATAFGSSAAGPALARSVGSHIARRSVSRLVPGAGAVAAGGLNYIATVTLGRLAIHHFASQAGVEVRGVAPTSVHPAMPWLRNATLRAFEAPTILAGVEPPFPEACLDALAELGDADREELLDLAVTAAADDRTDRAARQEVLLVVGEALGYDADEIEDARRSALEDVSDAAQRVGRLVGGAGSTGADAARKLWRRAGSLARRGAARVRWPRLPPPLLRRVRRRDADPAE